MPLVETLCAVAASGPTPLWMYLLFAGIVVSLVPNVVQLWNWLSDFFLYLWSRFAGRWTDPPLPVAVVDGRLLIDPSHPQALRAVSTVRDLGELGPTFRVRSLDRGQPTVPVFRGQAVPLKTDVN